MMLPLICTAALLTTAQSSINYIDMVIGKGNPAQTGDVVAIDYRGQLTDGTEFGSTKGRAPMAFELGKEIVIEGLEQAIIGMKPGGKRVVSIPPELGYGEKGNGPIPPNATLVFEITLWRVDKQGSEPKIEITEIAEGQGEPAKDGDALEVHYTATFLNGVKLDSSHDRNETFKVTLGKTAVIKGFSEGLIGMKEGGKRKVVIPYPLAYGAGGRPPAVPPFSTLVFDLEIVKIVR